MWVYCVMTPGRMKPRVSWSFQYERQRTTKVNLSTIRQLRRAGIAQSRRGPAYELDNPTFPFREEREFFFSTTFKPTLKPTEPSIICVLGLLPWSQSGRSMRPTTHLYLMSGLIMSAVVQSPTLYAFFPSAGTVDFQKILSNQILPLNAPYGATVCTCKCRVLQRITF